jgi:DNA polymerase-3 subunit chi
MLVDFYHLAASPLERVLPSICEKILANGERLLIVGEQALLAQLDDHLWSFSPEAFLPHGRNGMVAPAVQPILLSDQVEPLNGATNIAIADGVWREEALAFARTFYFFDSGHLDQARASWRGLKARPEADLRYWKQAEGGKWVQGP